MCTLLDDGVVSAFDAPFFGIGRHEATWIDPQHRLLLLCAVEACEDAMICGGIGALRHRGGGANGEQGTAVFMAIGASDYAHMAWNAFGQHSMRAGAHAGAGGGTFGAGAARLAEGPPGSVRDKQRALSERSKPRCSLYKSDRGSTYVRANRLASVTGWWLL